MTNIISVIIPIYNTPVNLFEKCIDSLISQQYENLEIILVDDGSSSGIEQICDKYADKYPNITTIHTNNNGLAAARNLGVKKSNGNWIMFLDSDDWLDPMTCYELSSYLKKYNFIDFITYGFYHDFENRCEKCVFSYDDTAVFDSSMRNELILNALKTNSLYSSSCWKIFKKSFLDENDLFHDEKIRQGSEDLEFMLRVIDSYNSTLCINKRYYHYVMNQNSITNSFNEKNAYSVLQCFKKMEDVIINKNEIVKDSFYIRSWNAICASIISGFMNPNNSLKYREKAVVIPEVNDYIRLIRDATYVLTDSFHAVSFCLNLEKQFYVYYPNKYAERLKSILLIMELTDRELMNNDYDTNIDYKKVNKILMKKRKLAKDLMLKVLDKGI